MSRPVRVIVLNADEEAGPQLRALLLGIPGVKIVAEVDEPALLARALAQFPAEVLLLHLDRSRWPRTPSTAASAPLAISRPCRPRPPPWRSSPRLSPGKRTSSRR